MRSHRLFIILWVACSAIVELVAQVPDTVFTIDGQVEAFGPTAAGRRIGLWSFFGIDQQPYKTVNYMHDGSCMMKIFSSQPYRAIYYRTGIDDVTAQYIPAPAFYLMLYAQGISDSLGGAIREGYTATYYPQGGVYCEGRYENDMRDSTWVYHYPDGIVSSKVQFLDDLPNGVFESYQENGARLAVGNYVMGRKSGEWLHYDAKGVFVEKVVW